MRGKHIVVSIALSFLAILMICGPTLAQSTELPSKVYVPYEKLKDVIGSEKQGVFVPYTQFQKLWMAAQGTPADVRTAPAPYLISKATFAGEVGKDLAKMRMDLTVDVLKPGWVEIPIGLGEVAVSNVTLKTDKAEKVTPPCLLRIVNGRYVLLTKGTGRRVITVDFVRQLQVQPGECVLGFKLPAAAITTLELLIPEENMKVDVKPMLAATTSQVKLPATKKDKKEKSITKLQAFLGSAKSVRLSWKPRTQAAANLASVVICTQLQTIRINEALANYDVRFNYTIRRRGVDQFTIQLPGDFRVTAVEGNNISRWDLEKGKAGQLLKVKLFSPAKDNYTLNLKMERFLKESAIALPLSPIVTHNVLRRTGLVALSHSPRRSVELQKAKNLARVDVGQLPASMRNGAVAYRFVTADYAGNLAIDTVEPRISTSQDWAIGVRNDVLELRGRLGYTVERVGVFQLMLNLPSPWKVLSVKSQGRQNIVEDFEVIGEGKTRQLKILLRQERIGNFTLLLHAEQKRSKPNTDVDFTLPLPDAKNLRTFTGRIMFLLADHFRSEIVTTQQLRPVPLNRAGSWSMNGLAPRMAFTFNAIDRKKPALAKLRIAVKPTQIFATAHRLLRFSAGAIVDETIIDYNIAYAPTDTLYLKMPKSLADAEVHITGSNIKEKPRLQGLPADQLPKEAPETAPADGIQWAYYKIVLQAPTLGRYRLVVRSRKQFNPEQKNAMISVQPVVAAGKLAGQVGHIAISVDKSASLAVISPSTKNLTSIDPGSATDLPYAPHRHQAVLAYRYDSVSSDGQSPFTLDFSVIRQKEAAVVTTQVTACIIEQALGRDGTLNTRATFILLTRRGDRLPITLPKGAKLFGVLLNGSEAPVESGQSPEVRIVRLPPSAGQASKVVIEVSYSLSGVNASALQAPSLPEDVPVQQTLWRIWLPEEDTVLAFDRTFAELTSGQSERMLRQMANNQPSAVGFKLPAEGLMLNFIRQGSAGTLRINTLRREWMACLTWGAILVIGVAMLKLGGFARCLVILALLLISAITSLFAPLFVSQVYNYGWTAILLVLLLWGVHWFFKRRKCSEPPSPVNIVAPEMDSDIAIEDDSPTEQPAETQDASDVENTGREESS